MNRKRRHSEKVKGGIGWHRQKRMGVFDLVPYCIHTHYTGVNSLETVLRYCSLIVCANICLCKLAREIPLEHTS